MSPLSVGRELLVSLSKTFQGKGSVRAAGASYSENLGGSKEIPVSSGSELKNRDQAFPYLSSPSLSDDSESYV